VSGGLRRAFQPVTDALTKPFVLLRVSPTAVTVATLIPGLAAAWAVSEQRWFLAAGLGVVGGLMDLIDGGIAKATNQVTPFGGFLDSVVDRVLDLTFLFGVGLAFSDRNGWLLVGLAVLGSYGTSYARARAHEAGGAPQAGWNQWFERGERLLVLGAGCLVEGILATRGTDPSLVAMHAAVGTVGVLGMWTMLVRIRLVRRTLASA